MDWAESIDKQADKVASTRSNRWRSLGLVGGTIGLLSLFMPYVRAADNIFGREIGRSLRAAEIAVVISQSNPLIGNLLLIGIVGGATLALAGGIFSIYLVFLGGGLMTAGGVAVLIITFTQETTALRGLVEISLSTEYGLIFLFLGGLIPLSALFIE